jgi:hypothetical protein
MNDGDKLFFRDTATECVKIARAACGCARCTSPVDREDNGGLLDGDCRTAATIVKVLLDKTLVRPP